MRNFSGTKFTTATAKPHGEVWEVLIFPGRSGKITVRTAKNYGVRETLQLHGPSSPFFARQKKKKKGFSFFCLWGDPVQNRPQNPALAGCLFSMRKSRSEVPETGGFRGRKVPGEGPGGQGKKRKKGCTKKNQESPRQTKPKKGPKRKVHMNFAHFFVNSGVFPWEKKTRFTSRTFVPECPWEKFMN